MSSKKFVHAGLFLLALLFLAGTSGFIVRGYEQAVVLRFGEIVGGNIERAGLYPKIPIFDRVYVFDKRVLVADAGEVRLPTSENEIVRVHPLAHWRIVDPGLFLRAVTTEAKGRDLLKQMVLSATRDFVARNPLPVLLASTSEADICSDDAALPCKAPSPFEPSFQKQLARLGIELLDVEILYVEHLPNVRAEIDRRIIAERNSAAERFRAEGYRMSGEIVEKARNDANVIKNEAVLKAAGILADAEGQALAMASQEASSSPEFYTYYNTLRTYRESIRDNMTLMVDSRSDLFQILNGGR